MPWRCGRARLCEIGADCKGRVRGENFLLFLLKFGAARADLQSMGKTINYYTGCWETGTSHLFEQDGQTVHPTILSQWGGIIEVRLDGIVYRNHDDEPIHGDGCYTLEAYE